MAQAPLDSINLELRRLFGNLARPTPPKEFNWDMAAHLMDSSYFIETNLADTLNTDDWVRMYAEMRNCAYDTTWLPPVDDVLWPCYNYGGDTVNILTYKFDSYRFIAGALDTNIYFDFDTLNNVITDKPNRPGWPYEVFTTFAVAPSHLETQSPLVTYRVGADKTFFDAFNALDAAAAASGTLFEINFGDGTGWQPVVLGQDNYFTVLYGNVQRQTIQARVSINGDPDGISISAIHNLSDIAPTPPDQIIRDFGMEIAVYEPCNGMPADKVKTIIYLEGIDLMDFIPFGGFSRGIDDIYTYQIEQTHLADLRNFGYRFLVVNWQNSRQDMHINTQHVIDLINSLKCQNEAINNTEEFVILGESMGGVIANLALLKFEANEAGVDCWPEKQHNCRLLITLDAPHGGAHIPMSIQRSAKFLRNHIGALYVGEPFGALRTRLFFESHDLFLDGDAAKQLLMKHVNTNTTLGSLTVDEYFRHSMRDAFLAEVGRLGNVPRHCKLVAMSNGNMNGHGQTRLWDGQPRAAGDRLLDVNGRYFATILRRRFQVAGCEVKLNNDPNGFGTLGEINAGTFWFKFKIRLFRIQISTGFNSVVAKLWESDMKPVGNSAGGILDYNSDLLPQIYKSNATFISAGNWAQSALPDSVRRGLVMSFGTDGFHWSFIPVGSALNNTISLNVPWDNLGTALINSMSPYDVNMGWKGDSTYFTPTTSEQYFLDNPYVRNQYHTDLRNDTLYDSSVPNAKIALQYDVNNCTGIIGASTRHIFWLNREIGDNEIYLENRVLPWHASYSVSENMYVNMRSPHYNYVGVTPTVHTIPSVYSKHNPFIIDANNGFGYLNTNIGTVNYQAPYSGPWGIFISGVGMCCQDFYRQMQQPAAGMPPKVQCVAYPNPCNDMVQLQLTNLQQGLVSVSLYNLNGKLEKHYTTYVSDSKYTCTLPLLLPRDLQAGLYMLKVNVNNSIFNLKIQKQ
jgi:hypothetical protein